MSNNTEWDLIVSTSQDEGVEQKIAVPSHTISTIGNTANIHAFRFISPQQYIPKEKYIDTTSYMKNPGDTVLFEITTAFNSYGPWLVNPIFEKLEEKADINAKVHWADFFSNVVRNVLSKNNIPTAADIIELDPSPLFTAESFERELSMKETFCRLLETKYREIGIRILKNKPSTAQKEAIGVLGNAYVELWHDYCSPRAQGEALQQQGYKNDPSPYQEHD